MSDALAHLPEPTSTARLAALLARVRERLTSSQREAMRRWEGAYPLDGMALRYLRSSSGDVAQLRAQASIMARRRRRAAAGDDGLELVPALLPHAATRPAVVSALLWRQIGGLDGDLASHLLQLVRERAGLVRMVRRLDTGDASLAAASDLQALVSRFADMLVDDACGWLEHVPPPVGGDEDETLVAQAAALEEARAQANRIAADELVGFAQRAASFLVQLSARRLDPLGFPLAREVQLETDPPLARRLAIADWAQRVGHRISPRGQMLVLGIAADAPWPLRLELIGVDLGCGVSGGVGLLLRLDGGGTIAATERAPVLLCFPVEPAAERGTRFERWLADAYPHAAQSWRAWS